jgi:hypothetical protein
MSRNETNLESLPSRFSSAAWSGIVGQFAYWLTEPAALIDRERLKHHFLASWGLGAFGSNGLVESLAAAPEKSPSLRFAEPYQHSQLGKFASGGPPRCAEASNRKIAPSIIPRRGEHNREVYRCSMRLRRF